MRKENLKTGQCLLVSGTSWLAKQIQWFQDNPGSEEGAKYNHVGMIIKIGDDWMVSEEGRYSGLIYTLLSDYEKKVKNKGYQLLVKEYVEPFTEQQVRDIEELCALYVNKGWYDFGATFVLDPVKYIWKKLTGKTIDTTPDNKDGKKRKRFRCSAWFMFVMHEITGKFGNYNDYDPVDIYYEDLFKVVST